LHWLAYQSYSIGNHNSIPSMHDDLAISSIMNGKMLCGGPTFKEKPSTSLLLHVNISICLMQANNAFPRTGNLARSIVGLPEWMESLMCRIMGANEQQ
jgi:hypothetical protein